ncbi:glutamine amidotransferase [candidate division WWE3 bacterium]|jgi:CobQ-like glutamine amidotransferase family enzyme|uniref:Lipid II isoglutaminyl synthase (glutamine-hydrolyzing) subunit GatD n=1 Tax=candidate division WWE3 bacterium TaxID=2053526 RepID=A0A3A4ZK00_UNCKA|nr:MAG: glutamine amidotransferase [candidate division WWE3 bacterium]
MKIVLAYFYPELLNLYGDNGNVEILSQRSFLRNIEVELLRISPDTRVDSMLMAHVNLVFMGGGPDSSQKSMYEDLLKNKGPYLKDYIEGEGTGLFICGSYQLLGHYYKAADGTILNGAGIFDLYTEHFGERKPRCIGNTVAELSSDILGDQIFKNVNKLGDTLVGFENHGGRTYLGAELRPLAKVLTGYGNNAEDNTEGAVFKNSYGTYFHGPLLARNPHFADYLIAKALKISGEELKALDDTLIHSAHTASKKLKQ